MENGTGETLEVPVDHRSADREALPAEPEQPKLETADHVKKGGRRNLRGHNHPANWGKLVVGCNGCYRVINRKGVRLNATLASGPKQPPEEEPIPDPQPDPQPSEDPQGVYITFEQLQSLMGNQANLAESLKEFARELKKPDPEEQERRADAKARKEKTKAMRIIEITAEEDAKRQRKEMCARYGHQKENGKSAIYVGQPFSDGFHHPMCHRCGWEGPLIRQAVGAV